MKEIKNIITIVLLSCLLVQQSFCKINVDAQQMLTYKYKEDTFGPRTFSLNSYVSLVQQDFSRKVVLLRKGEFTIENIQKIQNGKVYGIAIMKPENPNTVLSNTWIESYEYLLQKSPNYPVYFVPETEEVKEVISQLEKESRRTHIKFITNDFLGKYATKIRVNDFIGELKKDFSVNYQYVRSSTILLAGMDNLFMNTEATNHFPKDGSGLVAQLTIARSFSHLIKQFNQPMHNLIYYFCGTKFDNFASFSHFLGNNENTHFVNGAKQIIVLDTIMANDSFDIEIYNIDEDKLETNQFLLDQKKTAKAMNIRLNIKHQSNLFLNTTVLPTFKISDNIPETETIWDNDKFEKKLKFLQSFLFNQVYEISADSINQEVDKNINQKAFWKKLKDFVVSVPRSPLDIQYESEFLVDMERMVKLYSEKYIRTTYRIDNYGFYRSKIFPMTIAVAKHGFVDLLTFLMIILWVIALQLVCTQITFKEKSNLNESIKSKVE